MRSVDKAMLLAEYLSLDASNGVSSFINWVKNTDEYHLFIERLRKFRKTRSLKGKKLLVYGKKIRFSKKFTMEESIVMYGKMLHFLNVSDEEYYINPFISNLNSHNKMTIGDIKVNFDEKIIPLNEVSKNEGYSFSFKQEYIKRAMDEWMNEVEEFITSPIEKIKSQKNLVVLRKVFTPLRIVETLVLIIVLFGLLFVRFSDIDAVKEIYLNGYGNLLGLTYYLTLSYTIIYLFEVVILCIYLMVTFRDYKKNYKLINIDISSKIVDEKNKLELYIYKQFTNNQKLDEKISSFNSLSKLNKPIYYFLKRSAQNKKITSDKITEMESLSGSVYCALVVLFVVLLFICIGGK